VYKKFLQVDLHQKLARLTRFAATVVFPATDKGTAGFADIANLQWAAGKLEINYRKRKIRLGCNWNDTNCERTRQGKDRKKCCVTTWSPNTTLFRP